jgi:hypothetical protein
MVRAVAAMARLSEIVLVAVMMVMVFLVLRPLMVRSRRPRETHYAKAKLNGADS